MTRGPPPVARHEALHGSCRLRHPVRACRTAHGPGPPPPASPVRGVSDTKIPWRYTGHFCGGEIGHPPTLDRHKIYLRLSIFCGGRLNTKTSGIIVRMFLCQIRPRRVGRRGMYFEQTTSEKVCEKCTRAGHRTRRGHSDARPSVGTRVTAKRTAESDTTFRVSAGSVRSPADTGIPFCFCRLLGF